MCERLPLRRPVILSILSTRKLFAARWPRTSAPRAGRWLSGWDARNYGGLASTNGGGGLGDLASTNGGGGRGDEVEEKGEMDGGEEEEALLSPC